MLLIICGSYGCITAPKKELKVESDYGPTKNLLEIVSNFQAYAEDDTYKFSFPKDISGINIFEATLTRLNNYERNHPGKFQQIILFTKARAFERLHSFNNARATYEKLMNLPDVNHELKDRAKKNKEICVEYKSIIDQSADPMKMEGYIQALEKKAGAWGKIIEKYNDTVYEIMAREELEKVDVEKAEFIAKNWELIPNGLERAIATYKELINKHQESKNINGHIIRFGDFYTRLARAYATKANPEELTFDLDKFWYYAESAKALYEIVTRKDGVMEKIEAQGKLTALQAYVSDVSTRSQ